MEANWKRLNFPYQEYEISDTGLVRDTRNNCLKPQYPTGGNSSKRYMVVSLQSHFDDKYKVFYVHRLVAEYFRIKPENWKDDWVVHHNDGNSMNNHVYNLVWMDKHEHIKLPKAHYTNKLRVAPELIYYIYEMSKLGFKNNTLGVLFGLNQSVIYKIKNRDYKNIDQYLNSGEWVFTPKNIFKHVKSLKVWNEKIRDYIIKQPGETRTEWLARIKKSEKRNQTVRKFDCPVCGKPTSNIAFGKHHKNCKFIIENKK